MSPTERGRLAETHAAEYLTGRGFQLLDRNWRNRWCELDIVAQSAHAVHFIEVKYRRRALWGTGFDYITPDKLNRLRRAALAWTQAHNYRGLYQIDIISITGELESPTLEYLADAVASNF